MRLNEPVLDLEIWNAAKSIGTLKASGPDGLSASFFRECRDIIGMSVIYLVRDFFTKGSSLRLINRTNIALIPKVENPKSVSNYRPISLCNVSCKIITK